MSTLPSRVQQSFPGGDREGPESLDRQRQGIDALYAQLASAINDNIGSLEVVVTASIPSAGSDQDGKIVIEDAGTLDCNLIVYKGGQRYRFVGSLF